MNPTFPSKGAEKDKSKQKGPYPTCACGCGQPTNSNSTMVGYPDTTKPVWCFSGMCANKVREKIRADKIK